MDIAPEELEALKERVATLERRLGPEVVSGSTEDFELPVRGDEGEPPPEGKAFFDDLRSRMGDAENGLISIIGGVYRFKPGKNFYWQSRVSNYPLKPPIIECSDEEATAFASVFSSIQRLRLWEAMVGAIQSSAELRMKTGLGSGALYHHLRELMHAGFIEQRKRGRYTLTATGMVGVITFLHVVQQYYRKRRPPPETSAPH